MEHTATSESTSSHGISCGTSGHAARDNDHACCDAPESDNEHPRDRAEERARVKALRAQIDELNAEMAVASAEAERALAEERQRADRLDKQVEALSAEVVEAKKQAEAVEGRAERAEAGRDAEHAEAEALRTAIDALKAGQALMIDMHARALAVAQHDAQAGQQAAAELRRAEGEGAFGAAQGNVAARMSGQGRYPSTAETAPPTPGARCSSCFGTRWWTERHEPKGWRCATCHPPAHLSAEAIRREGEG